MTGEYYEEIVPFTKNDYEALIARLGIRMPNRLMQFFTYAHLPEDKQAISKQVAELAEKMDAQLPEGAEKTAGLRKLLESKDCFVRATMEK